MCLARDNTDENTEYNGREGFMNTTVILVKTRTCPRSGLCTIGFSAGCEIT